MQNNRYRLKEDKVLGKIKVASKGDIVTVVSTTWSIDGDLCTVKPQNSNDGFSVLAKLLTPIF